MRRIALTIFAVFLGSNSVHGFEGRSFGGAARLAALGSPSSLSNASTTRWHHDGTKSRSSKTRVFSSSLPLNNGELETTSVNMLAGGKLRDDQEGRPVWLRPQQLASRAALASLLVLAFTQRVAVFQFLDYVKNEWLLTTLNQLSASGPVGVAIYALFFCAWTMAVGVTTPVETAAGMAFGVKYGILASGSAKFLAAVATFVLARHRFASKIRPVVEENEVLSLMEESIHERPFQVALLCRFSPLPEMFKNAGMGVSSVQLRYFLASLVVHGFSFTCLWTWMGAETARVLQGFPASSTLKVLLTAATWIGFAAPVCIGLWLKSLRDKRDERRRQEVSSPDV